jgi:hypothetical protein
MERRLFLKRTGISLGLGLAVAGCSGGDSSDDVQDSDGDGVIDSQDYAPNDPDVQSKSDVNSGSTTTETDEGVQVDDIDLDTETPTEEDTIDLGDVDLGTETPTAALDYETSVRKQEFVPGPGYYQISFGFPGSFIVHWTVENMASSERDFDVFLMSSSEFEIYLDYINERSSRRPEVYNGGSAQGVTTSATRTATLEAGKYHLVIDNTDLGDAGDIGSEASREVRITLETKKA